MAGEKILCVDDEDPIRKLCTVYLAKRGYRVEAVANGFEALKLIEAKGPPDIVVTDVNMPLMNGLELVKRLREDRRTARILARGRRLHRKADRPGGPGREDRDDPAADPSGG
jgi:CheY-like chemotaxis protein